MFRDQVGDPACKNPSQARWVYRLWIQISKVLSLGSRATLPLETEIWIYWSMGQIDCPVGYTHLVRKGTNEEVYVPRGCNWQACERCWADRMRRNRESMRAQVVTWTAIPWMLTRSVGNDPSLAYAFVDLEREMANWKKAAQRDDDHPHNSILDWVAVWETTNRGKGYNLHEHRLIEMKEDWLEFEDWQENWNGHLDLQLIEHDATNYMTKYLTKGLWGGLTVEQAEANAPFLKGRRFMRRKRGSAPVRGPAEYEKCCLPTDQKCDIAKLFANDL